MLTHFVLMLAIGLVLVSSPAQADDEPICYVKLPNGELRDLTQLCKRPKPTAIAADNPPKCEFGEVQTAEGTACLTKEQAAPPDIDRSR
jgi:hypothetical protein